jgi:hypothetical protein
MERKLVCTCDTGKYCRMHLRYGKQTILTVKQPRRHKQPPKRKETKE